MAERAWAITRNGKIVISKVGNCEMLIFSKKWRAANAALDHEKVLPVKMELQLKPSVGHQSRKDR